MLGNRHLFSGLGLGLGAALFACGAFLLDPTPSAPSAPPDAHGRVLEMSAERAPGALLAPEELARRFQGEFVWDGAHDPQRVELRVERVERQGARLVVDIELLGIEHAPEP